MTLTPKNRGLQSVKDPFPLLLGVVVGVLGPFQNNVEVEELDLNGNRDERARKVEEKRRIFKHDREEYRKLYATYNRDADIVFIGDSITFNAPWSDFFPD